MTCYTRCNDPHAHGSAPFAVRNKDRVVVTHVTLTVVVLAADRGLGTGPAFSSARSCRERPLIFI